MNAGNSPSGWMRNRGTLKHRSVSGCSWMKGGGHVMRTITFAFLNEG